MKKVVLLFIAFLLCFSMLSCSSSSVFSQVPDLVEVDGKLATELLLEKHLIPVVKYEYSKNVLEGSVTRTDPAAGISLVRESKITVYISQGPETIVSLDSLISWSHIDYDTPDSWLFDAVYISGDYVFIDCSITPGVTFTFKSTGFGTAEVTSNIAKTVPISVLDSNHKELAKEKTVQAGKTFYFSIRIPISRADNEKPTNISCKISIITDDHNDSLKPEFIVVW